MWFGRLIMSDRESGDELQQAQGTFDSPYCHRFSRNTATLLYDIKYLWVLAAICWLCISQFPALVSICSVNLRQENQLVRNLTPILALLLSVISKKVCFSIQLCFQVVKKGVGILWQIVYIENFPNFDIFSWRYRSWLYGTQGGFSSSSFSKND